MSRVTGVPVLVGQTATINATLKPGSVHDEVTVTSNAVMIDQTGSISWGTWQAPLRSSSCLPAAILFLF